MTGKDVFIKQINTKHISKMVLLLFGNRGVFLQSKISSLISLLMSNIVLLSSLRDWLCSTICRVNDTTGGSIPPNIQARFLWFVGFHWRSGENNATVRTHLFSPPSLSSSSSSTSNCSVCVSAQVFHYYTSALDLVQLVSLTDLPGFLLSDTQFELYPQIGNVFAFFFFFVDMYCVSVCVVVPSHWTNRGLTGESVKAKLLLDQLRSLRGKVLYF